MPDNIERATLPLPEAMPGPPAKVQARFSIRPDVVDAVSLGRIKAAVAAAKFEMRGAISQSVSRAYTKSGLRKRTHNLIRFATQEYTLTVSAWADSVIIDVVWDTAGSAKAYWKAQAWSVPRGYSTKRPNMHIPAHRFLYLDERCKYTLSRIVNRAIAGLIRAQYRMDLQKKEPTSTTTEIPSKILVSPFRARKTLRRAGIPAPMARNVVSQQIRGGRVDVSMLLQANLEFSGKKADFAKLISLLQTQMQNAPA